MNAGDMEIWKDIAGYEGLYQVSSFGRIKSLEHKVYNPSVLGCSSYRTVPEIIRKPNIMKGYHCIALIRNKKVKVFRIHRLVAESFIGHQPSPYHQVNHIDGNKANNHVDNLEWVTPKENVEHAIRTGLITKPSDETKKKMSIASKNNWKRDEYRNRQSQASKDSWERSRTERINAITAGIHASNSKRYLRNREMIP